MVDECKKPNTDKKLIFKYEHFKENLDREKPRKKIRRKIYKIILKGY